MRLPAINILDDKLSAMPKMPNIFTSTNEKMIKNNNVKKEIKVLYFINPTAESRVPYKFHNNIFNAKPTKSTVNIKSFFA